MKCPFIKKNKNINTKENDIKINSIDYYLDSPFDEKNQPLDAYYNKIALPIRSSPYRSWYEKEDKVKNHAKYCLPLSMANSIGYILRSPATFRVKWDGIEGNKSQIEVLENKWPKIHSITNHSASGSFTIQFRVVLKTNKKHFTYIKGISNIRTKFNVMEALLESWWFEGQFGVVCLLNQPCDFIINEGDPIATIILLDKDDLKFDINLKSLNSKMAINFRIWEWWTGIKNSFFHKTKDNESRREIMDFFKKYNKKFINKNYEWNENEPFHDHDYLKGRRPNEEIKPSDRPHFLPKNIIIKNNVIDTYHLDHYNTLIKNENKNI